jgi:hypothetical protein
MTTTAKPTPSWRDVLPIHPAAELFPLMTPDELRPLGEDIKRRGLRVPIALWKEEITSQPALLDGRSRLDAIEAAGMAIEVRFSGSKGDPRSRAYVGIRYGVDQFGMRDVPANTVQSMSRCDDPHAFVVSLNIQRRHLTAEQKREIIAKLIKATPEKSDRQIAEMAKVDHHKVGKVRKEEEDVGKIPHVETRTDSKGRQQPVKKTPAAVVEQRHQARALKQERANERVRARREREGWQADVSRFAFKLIRLDIGIARELHHVLAICGADATQLMDDLAAGIEIEGSDDGLDIPASLRRAAP